MNKEMPQGKLTYHHTETKQNKAAVYADVYFEDENSTTWYCHASAFKFELSKGIMALTLDQWHKLEAQLELVEDDNETLGTHMQLVSVLNEFGYYPQSRQSALDLAENLLEKCNLSLAEKGE